MKLPLLCLNDEKLVAFALITPIDTAETTLSPTMPQVSSSNTYSIQTPLQVVVPQS